MRGLCPVGVVEHGSYRVVGEAAGVDGVGGLRRRVLSRRRRWSGGAPDPDDADAAAAERHPAARAVVSRHHLRLHVNRVPSLFFTAQRTYDTRCYSNVRSKADTSQLNLSTARNRQLKSVKQKKIKSKNGYAQK